MLRLDVRVHADVQGLAVDLEIGFDVAPRGCDHQALTALAWHRRVGDWHADDQFALFDCDFHGLTLRLE
jgi:P2-related tail formation protein